MSDALFSSLLLKLQAYKKKYYLNSLLKGLIFFFALACTAYLLVNVAEYFGKFNSTFRFIFFSSYLLLTLFGLIKWVVNPLAGLIALKKQMTNEEAAKEIGNFFPQVQDKLLNTLQLKNLPSQENLFLQASIEQKTKELSVVPFTNAISYSENKKYLKYLALPFVSIVIILIFIPQLFVESTARILNYSKEYTYPAPFIFEVENENLQAFKNEDFELNLRVNGSSIPDQVYIFINGRRAKMKKDSQGNFSYFFKNLQKDENFSFEAAGYNSSEYNLKVFARPDLKDFNVDVIYPAYLNKKKENVSNAGNLTIPEGTSLTWNFNTEDVENIKLNFSDSKDSSVILSSDNNQFSLSKRILKSTDYRLELKNKFGKGKEKIGYRLTVIPDQYPEINVEEYKDSVLYSFVTFGGSASDDYGLTKLKVVYRILEEGKEPGKYSSFPVKISRGEISQNFIQNWNLDTLNLKPGQRLEYYLQVWDNDGVNGHKSTKSKHFSFSVPGKEEIKEEMKNSSRNTESSISKTYSKSKKLKTELEKFEDKLKTKKDLNWQDKKILEDLLKQHKDLSKEVENLQKEYNKLSEKQQKFNEPNPEIQEKMKQLQKLMNELLDEETKKLYEEMQKMLDEKINKEELQKMLEQMKDQDQTLESELERTLEWFKQLEFEQKTEQIKKDLENLAKDQKDLAEKTKKKKENNDNLLKEQEDLNKKFEELEKDMKDLENLNNSMQNKKDMEGMDDEQQDVKENQQQGKEQLQKNQNKKAGDSQQKAGEKMEELAQKMASMQAQGNKEQVQENMDDLRAILENLIKLSFDQEDLMKDFRKVNQSDPRYLDLSQKQLKLKDDSKIIEDSLLALAKRVFQIQSFITRELGDMNKHLDASIKNIRDRRPDLASSNQQYTMTSINNLALMLNDVLKQMQQQMSSMSGGGKMCSKPGNNKKPGLGDLQKQLNQQLQQLKNGNKSGEALSKELAKLAAKQEMIRNALKELQKKAGGDKAGKELSKLLKEMEQTEKDLVNKRISQELLMRQKDIETRLLEAEKALRERDTDNKRESNTGKDLKRDVPPDFEKYLKEKERQIELLKTVNPSFTPYYKKEVNEYFQKIEK